MEQMDEERIAYILKEIKNIELIIAFKTKEDLENDLTLERAVSMTLQMIGEKMSNISINFQDAHPEIEWSEIRGLRNRISHDYKNLDFKVIFNAATVSVLELKQELLKIDFSMGIDSLLPKNKGDLEKGKEL